VNFAVDGAFNDAFAHVRHAAGAVNLASASDAPVSCCLNAPTAPNTQRTTNAPTAKVTQTHASHVAGPDGLEAGGGVPGGGNVPTTDGSHTLPTGSNLCIPATRGAGC